MDVLGQAKQLVYETEKARALARPLDPTIIHELAMLPEAEALRVLLELRERVGDNGLRAILKDPRLTLRSKQALRWDEDWRFRVYIAGRRWGKNKAAVAALEEAVVRHGVKSIALVGVNFAAFEKTIATGPSSVQHLPSNPTVRSGFAPKIEWPDYGATAYFYSSERPQGLYGAGAELVYADEAGQYATHLGVNAWHEINTIASEGNARIIITSSPYMFGPGLPFLRALLSNPKALVTRGSTLENMLLEDDYVESLYREHAGTRYWASMVEGQVLDEVEGALWSSDDIRKARYEVDYETRAKLIAACDRIVVAIDPATTVSETSNACGVVVAGRIGELAYVFESHGYKVLPTEWARRAAEFYEQYGASEIIAETNQGGDLVEHVLAGTGIPVRYKALRSIRNKAERAAPVHDRYSQRRVRHVVLEGESEAHELLTGEMVSFTDPPSTSDDVVDALVFAVTDLLVDAPVPLRFIA